MDIILGYVTWYRTVLEILNVKPNNCSSILNFLSLFTVSFKFTVLVANIKFPGINLHVNKKMIVISENNEKYCYIKQFLKKNLILTSLLFSKIFIWGNLKSVSKRKTIFCLNFIVN